MGAAQAMPSAQLMGLAMEGATTALPWMVAKAQNQWILDPVTGAGVGMVLVKPTLATPAAAPLAAGAVIVMARDVVLAGTGSLAQTAEVMEQVRVTTMSKRPARQTAMAQVMVKNSGMEASESIRVLGSDTINYGDIMDFH